MPAADRPRARAGITGLLTAASAGWLLLASGWQAAAATGGWTLAASPTSVRNGVPTNVVLTATDASGGASVGCVQIQVSSAWKVNGVTVNSATTGLHWTANPVSAGLVAVQAVSDADVLKKPGQFVRFTVNVTGTPAGTYTWSAWSFDHPNCSAGKDTLNLTMTVLGGSTQPPASTPTPTAVSTRTPARAPTAAPTASPTAIPSPTPTATSELSPIATQTPPATTLRPGSSAAVPSGPPGDGNEPGASGEPFAVPVGGNGESGGLTTDLAGSIGFEDLFLWVVPGLSLTVPGLLLVLIVAAQAFGGAVWLPLARRRIGEFGLRRRKD